MRLSPQELDKLVLHQAGFLAQKRLARGVRLNYPEAVALIATQLLEFIREGKSVAELMGLGKKLLGRRQVMTGVPEMIPEVQVEGTFADGSKLVTVHFPVSALDGDLSLALWGSFLPLPELGVFGQRASDSGQGTGSLSFADPDGVPGAYSVLPGEVELNSGRRSVSLKVLNTGDRPIQVGSHFHFTETNRALVFDRLASLGMRLDIPAGTAVRFEPGEAKTVNLVEIAGQRIVRGGNALVDGPADDPLRVLDRVTEGRFGHSGGMKP